MNRSAKTLGVLGIGALAALGAYFAVPNKKIEQSARTPVAKEPSIADVTDQQLMNYMQQHSKEMTLGLIDSVLTSDSIDDLFQHTFFQTITLHDDATGEASKHHFNFPSKIKYITARSFEHDVLQPDVPARLRKPSLVLFYCDPPERADDATNQRHGALQFRLLSIDPRFNRANQYVCNCANAEESVLRERQGIKALGVGLYVSYSVKDGELPKDAGDIRKVDTFYGAGVTKEDMFTFVSSCARWTTSHLDNADPSKVIILEEKSLRGGYITIDK